MGDGTPTRQSFAWTSQYNYGYPALTDFVAQDPDHETYVFRKFKKLGVRNILYLQGGLMKIEHDLKVLDHKVAASQGDPESYLSTRSWSVLEENSRKPSRDLEHAQRELAETLELKLKKYCQCSDNNSCVHSLIVNR